MRAYPPEAEQMMKTFYNTLNEKDRRRYAAIEALKLGHGGSSYISVVLGCSRTTISKAIAELKLLPDDPLPNHRIRAQGGGRRPVEQTCPDLDQAFLDVLKHHTAGDPQNDELIWTNLTLQQIINKLQDDHNIKVSDTVVRRLLKKHGFKRRKAQKKDSQKRVWTR